MSPRERAKAGRAGKLKRILDDYPTEPHDLYLVYPANRHQSPKLRVFMDMAAEHLTAEAVALRELRNVREQLQALEIAVERIVDKRT